MNNNDQFASFFFLGPLAAFTQLISSFLKYSVFGHFSAPCIFSLVWNSNHTRPVTWNAIHLPLGPRSISLALIFPLHFRHRSNCLITTATWVINILRMCAGHRAVLTPQRPTPNSVSCMNGTTTQPVTQAKIPAHPYSSLFSSLWNILFQNIIRNNPHPLHSYNPNPRCYHLSPTQF